MDKKKKKDKKEKSHTKLIQMDGQKKDRWQNKIEHSSRSSSIQRNKTTAYQRCLVMLNNFEKFNFPSIEKRWTKDKETDG